MKKIASAAIVLFASATLAACGADNIDGHYIGTYENEGITMQADLTVEGEVCQMTFTAPLVGDLPVACEVDQDAKNLIIEGEPNAYEVDGDTLSIDLVDADEDLVLKKTK